MLIRALNIEILLSALWTRELRPDTSVSGSEFPILDVRIISPYRFHERLCPIFVEIVVDAIDRYRIRTESHLPADIQRDMDTQACLTGQGVHQVCERSGAGDIEIVAFDQSSRRDVLLRKKTHTFR